MKFILDASVAAKWFNVEDLSEKAVEARKEYVEGAVELAAPAHIIYEVGNSVWKNPQLADKDAIEAIALLLRMGLRLLEPSVHRVSRSMEIARLKRLTFYDAIYLQAAEELEATLLTADEVQIVASKGIAEALHLREFKSHYR